MCILLLFGDIAWLSYLVTNRTHRKEVRELRNSNNVLNEKYNRLDTMVKELEKRSQETQTISDSRISSLTADLNACQNNNLVFIAAKAHNDSTIASLENRLHDYEQNLRRTERLFVQQMALEPTWIKAGEVFTAFNNDVAIVFDEASDKNRCPSGSAASVRLNIGKYKKNLCLQTDRLEVFTCKEKQYFFSLLEVRENDQAHEYLVSILK